MADPEHFQSSFFAPFGANTFQWQIRSNRIPFRWQIKSATAAKVPPRTNKSCSPKIGGFNRNSRDIFFSHVALSSFASRLLSSSNCYDDRSGKCAQRPQRENGCCTPTRAAHARNQAVMSSAPTITGCTWRTNVFFFPRLPMKRPKKPSSRAALGIIETGKGEIASRVADVFGSSRSKGCRGNSCSGHASALCSSGSGCVPQAVSEHLLFEGAACSEAEFGGRSVYAIGIRRYIQRSHALVSMASCIN